MASTSADLSPLRRWLSVLAGALMLCTPALLNNFPFLYADTGTYLDGGFKGHVSDIRPITYGLFLRHVSLMESLWLVVLVQAIVVSWAVHAFFRTFSTRTIGIQPLVAIFLLTLTTGVGIVTGMLMPDFWTPVMLLCGALLVYGERLPARRLVAAGVLFWLALASHHSHAFIFLGLSAALLAGGLLAWRKTRSLLRWRRALLVAGLWVAGYFTIPLLHQAYSGEFFWSKASSVFLTNRVHQMGLLQPFLNDNCMSHTYNLCPFKDALPDDLLWSPDSPLAKTGGWAANEGEYGRLLGDFFGQPRYARKFGIKSAENAVMQFFTFEGQVIFPETEKGYPFQVMKEVLPEYLPAIRRSLQFNYRWHSEWQDTVQRFVVYGSFLLLLGVFVFRQAVQPTPLQTRLAAYFALALATNAIICGCVSMVDMRFQYRVVWLAPMLVIWLLGEWGWFLSLTQKNTQ